MAIENKENPLFIDVKRNSPEGEDAKVLEDDIRKLCESQPFAVLATQGKKITNASLISFAVSHDLKNIVFATPINTEKYDFIAAEENVSILVDDRSLQQEHINEISALTVIGKGKILSDENEIIKWSDFLTSKHQNLKEFLKAPSTSVILVDVVGYNYVNKFQKVSKWDPNKEI